MAARISAEAERRILALWKSTNHSSALVAEQVGVSSATVLRTLARHGVKIDPEETRIRKRRTTLEQDREIVARYLTGEAAQSIADAYGLKFHLSVLQRVRETGHEVRPPGPPLGKPLTEDQGEEVLRLRNQQGLSQESIARLTGLSQTKISRFLIVNGHRTWPLSRHPNHNGGPAKTSGGYMVMRVDESDPLATAMASRQGYVKEHRLVMARALGRPLTRQETVHHVNGDRADNRLENLQLRFGAHGKGVSVVCHDCGSRNVGPIPL